MKFYKVYIISAHFFDVVIVVFCFFFVFFFFINKTNTIAWAYGKKEWKRIKIRCYKWCNFNIAVACTTLLIFFLSFFDICCCFLFLENGLLTQCITGRSSVHTPMCFSDTTSPILGNGSRNRDPSKLIRLLWATGTEYAHNYQAILRPKLIQQMQVHQYISTVFLSHNFNVSQRVFTFFYIFEFQLFLNSFFFCAHPTKIIIINKPLCYQITFYRSALFLRL